MVSLHNQLTATLFQMRFTAHLNAVGRNLERHITEEAVNVLRHNAVECERMHAAMQGNQDNGTVDFYYKLLPLGLRQTVAVFGYIALRVCKTNWKYIITPSLPDERASIMVTEYIGPTDPETLYSLIAQRRFSGKEYGYDGE